MFLIQSFRLCIAEKKVKALCVAAGRDIKTLKQWREEMKAGNGFLVWENANEQHRYVWFADASCAWRIPLTHPMDRLLCEATCTLLQSRQEQYTTPPPKGLAIELSGKWQYLLTWNTHILPIAVRVGSRTGEGTLDAAVARRKTRPGSFVAGEGWGLSWQGLFSGGGPIVS